MHLNAIDYKVSQRLHSLPFYSLIAAAMRGADSINLVKLQSCFPEIWESLQARYDAGGGILESDNIDTDKKYNQCEIIADNYIHGI